MLRPNRGSNTFGNMLDVACKRASGDVHYVLDGVAPIFEIKVAPSEQHP